LVTGLGLTANEVFNNLFKFEVLQRVKVRFDGATKSIVAIILGDYEQYYKIVSTDNATSTPIYYTVHKADLYTGDVSMKIAR